VQFFSLTWYNNDSDHDSIVMAHREIT